MEKNLSNFLRLKNCYKNHRASLFTRLQGQMNLYFPELRKLIQTQEEYLQLLKESKLDFANTDSVSEEIRKAYSNTVGAPVSEGDKALLLALVDSILDCKALEKEYEHVSSCEITKVAPAISALVGTAFTEKLLTHFVSLEALASSAASTVQIFGAERTFFNALKEKRDTPKYGILAEANFVNSAPQKTKGRVARRLAAKIVLCARMDFERYEKGFELAKEYRKKILNSASVKKTKKTKTTK